MIVRILKWFAAIFGGLILIMIVGVVVWIVQDDLAFAKVNITDALVRDGKYDPAEHFTFDRACIYPPEWDDSFLLEQRGYEGEGMLVPASLDPLTFWTVILIDDHKKTYRKLFALERTVQSPGLVCNSSITLRTQTVDGRLTTYLEQDRTH